MARKSKCKLDYSQVVMIALISLALLLPSAQSATVLARFQRSESDDSSTMMTPVKYCSGNSPCGWAVYLPSTRIVDYFMRNTCECPVGKGCIKTDDDLSVSAYVYRCRADT